MLSYLLVNLLYSFVTKEHERGIFDKTQLLFKIHKRQLSFQEGHIDIRMYNF
jgi:hypothetical protein